MGLFIGRIDDAQEDTQLPVLVSFHTVKDGFVGGGSPLRDIVLVGKLANADNVFSERADCIYRGGHFQDDFPERDGQIDVPEVCGVQEHRGNLLGLVSGNAASDGGNVELQLLVLVSKGGETLYGRGQVIEAFHGGDGV